MPTICTACMGCMVDMATMATHPHLIIIIPTITTISTLIVHTTMHTIISILLGGHKEMKLLILALLCTIFLVSLVSAPHTDSFELHQQQHQKAKTVSKALLQQYEKVYSGCFNYPYGPCPYEMRYFSLPYYGRDYSKYQHWLTYNRPIIIYPSSYF